MTINLPALLEILKDPNNPAFAQAAAQLAHLNPADLAPAQIPFLLAQIDTVIATLTTQKEETAQQLNTLRTKATALKSYGQHQ